MITFEHVSKVYPDGTVAAADLDFAIEPGEFVSIVGQSGAGKTTIARMIIAEEKPTEGKIIIGGWDISHIAASEIPVLRRQIGVVFQDFKLLKRKTVAENISFALEVCGAKRKKINKIVPQVLKIVGLEKKTNKFPDHLSGGEQQRVVIARALVHRPKILVADEPTGNLDSVNTEEIIEILKKINEFGTTILLVTHNRDVVNRLHRRVVTLSGGQISSDEKEGKYRL